MLLILNDNNIDIDNILFGGKIKNNIIDNSFFYQLYYGNQSFTLSSLVFEFNIPNISISSCYNKQKIEYDYEKYKSSFEKIINLENTVLEAFMERKNINSNMCYYKMEETFKNNYIKISIDNIGFINRKNCNILIKISGIWENNNTYGINYKFIVK
jgi:hypothetical protein